jgi:hypothetical protein
MKKLVIALSALSLFAGSGASAAVAHKCRDSKGHFVKCPHHAMAAAHKCRDSKGHFVKCRTKSVKAA